MVMKIASDAEHCIENNADTKILAIRNREASASRGPWNFEPHGEGEALFAGPSEIDGSPIHRANILNTTLEWDANEKANKDFISNAREDIPFLLQELDCGFESIVENMNKNYDYMQKLLQISLAE